MAGPRVLSDDALSTQEEDSPGRNFTQGHKPREVVLRGWGDLGMRWATRVVSCLASPTLGASGGS